MGFHPEVNGFSPRGILDFHPRVLQFTENATWDGDWGCRGVRGVWLGTPKGTSWQWDVSAGSYMSWNPIPAECSPRWTANLTFDNSGEVSLQPVLRSSLNLRGTWTVHV